MNKYLLYAACLFFLFQGCTEGPSRKEFPCGFLGLGRVGNPDSVMGHIVDRINDIYKKDGKFPDSGKVMGMLPPGKMFIYYSFVEDKYQLAYWSGETTWIYDSETDSYYETEEDMIREKWYPVRDSFVDMEKINYTQCPNMPVTSKN